MRIKPVLDGSPAAVTQFALGTGFVGIALNISNSEPSTVSGLVGESELTGFGRIGRKDFVRKSF